MRRDRGRGSALYRLVKDPRVCRGYWAVALVTGATAACTGSGGLHSTVRSQPRDGRRTARVVDGVEFVRAPSNLTAGCRRTAHYVGYAVPCPNWVPVGLTAGPTGQRCPLSILGPQRLSQFRCTLWHCPRCRAWRGWIFGSSVYPHLVISGAPFPVRGYWEAVDGPLPFPGHVHLLDRIRINGWDIQVLTVPQDNAYSAFAGHVAFVWTAHGHTYAVGFHDVDSRAATIAWDHALVSSMRMMQP